jgi:hypothetical protein
MSVEPGTCLAVDVRAEGPASATGRVGVDVGVVDGDLVLRLARPELRSRDESRSFRDLRFARYAGRQVALRLAAWALDDEPSPTAVIAGARLHRCGDGAPWGFGRR